MSTSDASEKKAKKSQTFHLDERTNYRLLLLSNPNYFGNLKESPLIPVLSIVQDTTYERLAAVGYQPQARRLEAIVFVTQPTGYGGGLCSNGSTEFVRFYLSFDNGATWQDQGLTGVGVHDLGLSERIEYAVALPVSPTRHLCFEETANVVLVRAILSWNQPPPANTPGFLPIWGNVVETHIQIAPQAIVDLPHFLDLAKIKVSAKLQAFAKDVDVVVRPQAALGPAALTSLYAGKGVPPHRFLFPALHALQTGAAAVSQSVSSDFVASSKIDVVAVAGAIATTEGDTAYEILDAVGLNPNVDLLEAVLTIRQPVGYSGSLCSQGSYEYVAFWIDWGTGWQYAGTSSVNVHDISAIPPGGINYAVYLPVDASAHRKPCAQGPVTARVRATLSWQVPPPPGNPDFVPVWGNRDETNVQIAPGTSTGTDLLPLLRYVGDIAVDKIDGAGLIQNGVLSSGATWSYNDAPFGGRIDIAGTIVNGASTSRYRIGVQKMGSTATSYLTNEPTGIPVVVETWTGTTLVSTTYAMHADPNGWYAYQDYDWTHSVDNHILTRWYTGAAEDGATYLLWLEVKDNLGNVTIGPSVAVQVDNSAVSADLTIDFAPGGDCADFNVGDVFTGEFTASARHYGTFGFVVRPPIPANGHLPTVTAPNPSGPYPILPDPGVAALSGTYGMTTGATASLAAMNPCGYALTIEVSDRTNVDSGVTTHYGEASVGFCLRAVPTG